MSTSGNWLSVYPTRHQIDRGSVVRVLGKSGGEIVPGIERSPASDVDGLKHRKIARPIKTRMDGSVDNERARAGRFIEHCHCRAFDSCHL